MNWVDSLYDGDYSWVQPDPQTQGHIDRGHVLKAGIWRQAAWCPGATFPGSEALNHLQAHLERGD